MTPDQSKEFLERLTWEHKTENQQLTVSNCIASWTDICGFGNLLERNSWDLQSLQENGMVILLSKFHSIAGRPLLVNPDPLPNDKIIVLNDGVARTIDLTHKDKLEGYYFLIFLRELLTSHYLLLGLTKIYGVGVRTVISGGERIQYSPASTTGHSALYYDEDNVSEFGKKLLNTTFVYNPIEFQMNTGFAKAYTIDALGTKSNIEVNGLYIEKSFFDKIDGVKDVKIDFTENDIELSFKEKKVFKLDILKRLNLTIKGLDVLVFHIDKYFIYKEFDGDDLEFDLYS